MASRLLAVSRYAYLVSSLTLLFAANAAQASDRQWQAPKTEHGHPDLQGLWDFGTKTPFQRPTALGEKRAYTEQEALDFEAKARADNLKMDAPIDLSKGAPAAGDKIGQESDNDAMERRHDLTRVAGEYRTSIIIDPTDGRIPRRKEFLDHFGQLAARKILTTDGPEVLETPTRCLTTLPVPSIYPLPWSTLLQIVQTQDHVVLFAEMIHDARIIPLDATRAVPAERQWMGSSVARFEGATLVVRTVHFRNEQSYAAILPMSGDFELTERYTRTGRDEILYSFTVVDPQAYTRPFTGERTLKRAAPRDRILEFACHEGNYSVPGILAGARKQERDSAQAANASPGQETAR